MRGNSRLNKLQIPKLIKPYTPKQDLPFEKYQHFVVAPAPIERSIVTTNNGMNSINKQPNVSPKTFNSSSESESPQTGYSVVPFEVGFSNEDMDNYIVDASSSLLSLATESFLKKHFNALNVVYWQYLPELESLFSQTYNIICPNGEGIPSFCFFSRSMIKSSNPLLHPHYSPKIDSKFVSQETSLIVFPLWDYKNVLCSVIQISRQSSAHPFTEEDEKYLLTFASKFRTFSKLLLNKPLHEGLLMDILRIQRLESLFSILTTKLTNYFNCRSCEIWKADINQSKIYKYGSPMNELTINNSGIVGDCILTRQTRNLLSNKLHPSYIEKIDGKTEEALLVIPVEESTKHFIYAVVLRGPKNKAIFTLDDELIIQRLASFIILSTSNSDHFTQIDVEYQTSQERRESLAALLEVAEVLSGQLDIGKLTEIIMEKGRQLTHADRCSLFLVNHTRDRLITSFHRGLENSINIPIDKGIAGLTIAQGKVFNIPDAYNDPSFDPSIDLETGYRTRSILSVPIFNNRGIAIGVTEMVNKNNNEIFSEWDSQMIQIFNVFCGISLENARLYSESIDMAQQLRSFFDVSFSLSRKESIHRILGDIIQNARRVIEAQCASLFLIDDTAGVLVSFLVDGGKVPATLPLSSGIVGACAKSKECIVVNNTYDDPRFNRSVDFGSGFKTDSLLVAPVISSSGDLLGVVEMVNKINGQFNKKDVDLLQSFATFSAVSLENSRLKSIAELGTAEIELHKLINEHEKGISQIPEKLQLSPEQKKTIESINFFCYDWAGVGHFRIVFFIFNKFGLMDTFSISNELLFRFIHEIRSRYNDVPYHNWAHAVDVTQYIAYEVSLSHLESVLLPIELLSLFVASICHDVNHDGFNNIYNVKAETPLGILFKDQSVMETHHCDVTIQVLSKDEFNLFYALTPSDTKKAWNLVIKLILATDMAHHFKLVKDTTTIVDEGNFTMTNNENRVVALQLLLKVADISNVSRPFKTADKWCDILCEEFFRQGDNEKRAGIGLTSPLNDRDNPNKPKSQIGFYNFICIPLYQIVSKIFHELNINLESVKENLEVWKSMMPPA